MLWELGILRVHSSVILKYILKESPKFGLSSSRTQVKACQIAHRDSLIRDTVQRNHSLLYSMGVGIPIFPKGDRVEHSAVEFPYSFFLFSLASACPEKGQPCSAKEEQG